MSFLIYDIKDILPEEYPLYFCDANVWIAALKYYGHGGEERYEVPYQEFIDAIVNLNEINDPKLLKKVKHQPKVVLTSLVLSEIINAYMRNVAMKSYFGGDNTYRTFSFKKDYRDKPDSDYKAQLKDLCTDIMGLSDYTVLMDDDFKALNPIQNLDDLAGIDLDFNDFYYRDFLKKHNIPLVTHDKDCKFDGVITITAQRKLIDISDI